MVCAPAPPMCGQFGIISESPPTLAAAPAAFFIELAEGSFNSLIVEVAEVICIGRASSQRHTSFNCFRAVPTDWARCKRHYCAAEGGLSRHCCLLIQKDTKLLLRVCDPQFDSFGGRFEHLCDLPLRVPLDGIEHYGRSQFVWELRDRLFQS